jgi:hypothetical protein
MNDFKQSNEYAIRRATRNCIRKGAGLTRTERDILTHLTALWYHHRNNSGIIRPGRKAIAKKCQCSIPTVTRALSKFTEMQFIEAVKYAKGGRNATRWTVDISTILMTLDGFLLSLSGGNPRLIKGEIEFSLQAIDMNRISAKNDPVREIPKPDQNDPRSICMLQRERLLKKTRLNVSSQEPETREGGETQRPFQKDVVILPFPVRGAGDV